MKVVGRWVRVYRPTITGDDPTMYFERLSGDRLRGIIIPKRPAPGPVTIVPKGLLPAETYTVSFHESGELSQANRQGLDGKRDQDRKDAAGRTRLLESAAASRQQARQGTAHRARAT